MITFETEQGGASTGPGYNQEVEEIVLMSSDFTEDYTNTAACILKKDFTTVVEAEVSQLAKGGNISIKMPDQSKLLEKKKRKRSKKTKKVEATSKYLEINDIQFIVWGLPKTTGFKCSADFFGLKVSKTVSATDTNMVV